MKIFELIYISKLHVKSRVKLYHLGGAKLVHFRFDCAFRTAHLISRIRPIMGGIELDPLAL